MKHRISAILLAFGLGAAAFSMGVNAAEAETEQVTEAMEAASPEAETEAPTQEDQAKAYMTQILTEIASWDDAKIETILASDDQMSAAIASNWQGVKQELGDFVEVNSVELADDGLSIKADVKYSEPKDDTEVIALYTQDAKTSTVKLEWEVNYTFTELMKRAALNTLMGVGIVFLVLLFLSILIGNLHHITDAIEGKGKKAAPAPAPKAAPAPVAAPVVEEEDLTDDLELVAVITAAIAASENTSSDGFVVRSIKKANKRNWQRA